MVYDWRQKKMSRQKGIGSSAVRSFLQFLPPEVFRFNASEDTIKTHLILILMVILFKSFDDYDRCLNAYFLKLENKLPKDKPAKLQQTMPELLNFLS